MWGDTKKGNNLGIPHLINAELISTMDLTFVSAIYKNGSVYVVYDGKILYVGWDLVGGGSVVVFIVLQVGDIKIGTGQTVKKGQLIGNFTSSHLHLGMTKKNGVLLILLGIKMMQLGLT